MGALKTFYVCVWVRGAARPHRCRVILLLQLFTAGCNFVLSWVYSAGYFKFLLDRDVFLLGCFGVWAYLVNALAGFIFELRLFLLQSLISLFFY